MGLQSLNQICRINDSELPFLNEWLEICAEDQDGNLFVSECFYKVKSGKGYMIATSEFNCFVWSKSKTTDYILMCLIVAIEERKPLDIVVQVDRTKKGYFQILLDFEEGRYWERFADDSYSHVSPEKYKLSDPYPWPHLLDLPSTPNKKKKLTPDAK
jgi:hypothetical protein